MMGEEERSRVEIIIHEIECGGFTFEELNEVIEAATEEQNRKEDD